MNQLFYTRALLVTMLSFGCGAQAAASPTPHQHVARTSSASRNVELPVTAGVGEPREVRVLVDESALKLVSIVLRGGTVLPTHRSEVPVTIVALHGSGVVLTGDERVGVERLRLDPTHAVVLSPNVPHAVEPDAGTDLVLLVHHLGPGLEHPQ